MNIPSDISKVVIAIDGPSGAGKSTVSKMVAEKLGLAFVDTGAMYRSVALKASRKGISPDNSEKIEALACDCNIYFRKEDGKNLTFLDGEDVSEAIRTPEISLLTSRVSAIQGVRKAMVEQQRQMGRAGGVILDGRDVGTVIFPDTPFKFYVDASLEVRAKRRQLELSEKGGAVPDESSTMLEMAERDSADKNRKESPLVRADDACYVDTSGMTQEEVAGFIIKKVESSFK